MEYLKAYCLFINIYCAEKLLVLNLLADLYLIYSLFNIATLFSAHTYTFMSKVNGCKKFLLKSPKNLRGTGYLS